MTMTEDMIPLYALLIANAALLAAVGLALAKYRRQLDRFERFWSSPTGAALAQSAAEPAPRPQAMRHLERRVGELQRVIRTLETRPAVAETRPTPKLPIENAVRMAQHGASIDDLVKSCGLNIGEAQLMRKLHGRKGAAAPTSEVLQ
ncbi:MAG: DUF2802 domain-containing protein [Woeseiaceae bacterium]|nr:DUF2802 domain-containing protein [Woeseiaceae bacterium]